MSLNSRQRLIFVYFRSKDDHKSCTPAGAKLTNEYTRRTNKNDPCTVSVIPPQLCTFFRKRTFSTEERKNSSDLWFDSSEVSVDSSEEFFLSSRGIGRFLRELFGKFLGRNLNHRRGSRNQREFVTTVWQQSNRVCLVIVMCSSWQTDYNASALL